MDLSRSRVVLRQRSVLDVLDLALRFVVAHAGAYARVTLVAVVPAALVSWAVARTADWFWGWVATILLALYVTAARRRGAAARNAPPPARPTAS